MIFVFQVVDAGAAQRRRGDQRHFGWAAAVSSAFERADARVSMSPTIVMRTREPLPRMRSAVPAPHRERVEQRLRRMLVGPVARVDTPTGVQSTRSRRGQRSGSRCPMADTIASTPIALSV